MSDTVEDTVAENPEVIAEEFNNFFVNVGKEMARSIPICESNNSPKYSHISKGTTNSIFFHPSSDMEVHSLINQIKSNQAKRSNDVESKFIKLANPVISYIFLSELFILCLLFNCRNLS